MQTDCMSGVYSCAAQKPQVQIHGANKQCKRNCEYVKKSYNETPVKGSKNCESPW